MIFMRIVLSLMVGVAVVTGFQNCSPAELPDLASVSSSSPDDIILLSVPSDLTVNEGGLLQIYVEATSKGNHALSYRWLKNGVELPGQNGNSFAVPSAAMSDGGQYSVEISNKVDADTLFVQVTVSPTSVLTIAMQPQAINLDAATSGQLSVVASVSPAQNLTYQWFKDGVPVGGNGSILVISGQGAGRAGNYYVRVTTTQGVLQSVQSNTVRVTATETFNV